MKKATLNTIAQKTGFSPTTVSRVLNGKHKQYHISDKTYQIIHKEAQQCGFSPDFLARALRNGSTKIIGVTIPNLSNPFFGTIASYTIKQLAKRGHSAIIADCEESEENLKKVCSSIFSMRVEGLLVIPCGNCQEYLEQLAKKVPIVLIDRYYNNTQIPFVTTDNYHGAKEATEKLISLGHRDITCIQGEIQSLPCQERIKGYKDAMNSAGLTCHIVGESFTLHNGYEQCKRLLQSEKRPSAILTLSNTITLGAMKACKEFRISVPKDLSLLSYDDVNYMNYTSPSIARVGQPLEEISRTASDLLINIIEGKQVENNQIFLPTYYVHGDSIQQNLSY